jgi:hypothetical protein
MCLFALELVSINIKSADTILKSICTVTTFLCFNIQKFPQDLCYYEKQSVFRAVTMLF